jgi:ankyrin repeat protein
MSSIRRTSRSFSLVLSEIASNKHASDCIRLRSLDGSLFIPQQLEEEDIKTPKSMGRQLVVTCRNAYQIEGATGRFMLCYFIQGGADLNACDVQGSALMWLAYFGCSALFEQLLNAGASITVTSEHNYTALHAAAQKGHLEIVKYIIENKLLPINCQGRCGSSPLHLAVQ